jgi:hypothetical protein
VALYIVWEVTVRGLWTDGRTLRRLILAIAIVALATMPFVIPYIRLRHLGFEPRSLDETDQFGADILSYLTADAHLRLWGGVMRAIPKAEGSLFPGLTITGLAFVGIWDSGFGMRERGVGIRDSGGWTRFRSWLCSPACVLVLLTIVAVAMSFGPRMRLGGTLLAGAGPYSLFYEYVPGFDGLRVPARFDMIVTLGLAALAACGAAAVSRFRRGRTLVVCACALMIAESVAVPIPLNDNWIGFRQPYLAPPPPNVPRGKSTSLVYGFAASLPAHVALLELPLGEIVWDTRYMFYSTTHWRPLVNGYSGGAPPTYGELSDRLGQVFDRPESAWEAVLGSGATHVIVHEAAYLNRRGSDISEWLLGHAAREVFRFAGDRVFELPAGAYRSSLR